MPTRRRVDIGTELLTRRSVVHREHHHVAGFGARQQPLCGAVFSPAELHIADALRSDRAFQQCRYLDLRAVARLLRTHLLGDHEIRPHRGGCAREVLDRRVAAVAGLAEQQQVLRVQRPRHRELLGQAIGVVRIVGHLAPSLSAAA